MPMAKLLVLLALLSVASAASINVVNSCGDSITVAVRSNANGPQLGPSSFGLGSGQSMGLNTPGGWAGNIALATTPTLLAEFSVDQNGQDFYDLSAVDGFVFGRGLSVNGRSCSANPSICPGGNAQGNSCVNPNRDDGNTAYAGSVRANCPDAYSWSKDDSKTVAQPSGGSFTVVFCP